MAADVRLSSANTGQCLCLRDICTHILTSSTRVGKILRVRRPTENLLRTPAKPLRNDILSDLDFVLKLDRSRKLSVDIAREEKKGCDGRVTGVGRCCEPRVTRERSKAFKGMVRVFPMDSCNAVCTLKVRIKMLHPGHRSASVVPQASKTIMILERRISFAMNGVDYRSERVHVRGC
jgi:hypothetical protein